MADNSAGVVGDNSEGISGNNMADCSGDILLDDSGTESAEGLYAIVKKVNKTTNDAGHNSINDCAGNSEDNINRCADGSQMEFTNGLEHNSTDNVGSTSVGGFVNATDLAKDIDDKLQSSPENETAACSRNLIIGDLENATVEDPLLVGDLGKLISGPIENPLYGSMDDLTRGTANNLEDDNSTNPAGGRPTSDVLAADDLSTTTVGLSRNADGSTVGESPRYLAGTEKESLDNGIKYDEEEMTSMYTTLENIFSDIK